MQNITEIGFFFAQGVSLPGITNASNDSFFLSQILTGSDRLHFGGEFGIEAQITPTIKLTGVAAVGQHTYANNPQLFLSADEFAIVDITRHIDTEKYEELIRNIFKKLHHFKMSIDKNIISIDITIGLSTVEKNGYESAKIALDYAKKHKKPFMMYSSTIDYRKENSVALKYRDKISLAIDENRIVAVYQPIVDKNMHIVKYEALMRLKEENSQKLISPLYFLDVAIKTRLYSQLSHIIIFKALEMMILTKKKLSINFTYSDIKNANLIEDIESFLYLHREVGYNTVFEITESENIENYGVVKNFITRFKKYGVKIAIDDFGSGFSNFNYILEIEPDYLKIDGTLIRNIDTDVNSHTLVEAIVKFSHKLEKVRIKTQTPLNSHFQASFRG